VRVLNVRWVGVATDGYVEMRDFVEQVLGLRVSFDDPTTVEYATVEGDALQPMAPGDPYFDFFTEDRDRRRARRDTTWEWIHVRAPDGNPYELASRLR
jgi:catechol 2,3-dioxygenase-like lactoylglutathione lyase family enzyme